MKRFLCIIVLFAVLSVAQSSYAIAADSPRQEIVVNEPTVVSRPGAIEFSCTADGRTYTFYVYSITGQLVKRLQLCESNATVEIAKGCYIIKCEAWTKKVLVG